MGALLWLSVAILVGLYICGPIVDPDLFWHLTVGRWILAHKEIPVTEHWNMFAVGMPWRAYSWSFEATVAFIELHFGVNGLLLTKVALALSIVFVLSYVFSQIARDWFFGLLLGVVVSAACYNHLTLRPQSVTWILLGLALLYSEKIVREGKCSFACAAAIVCIFSLWANLHITTLIGIIIGVIWVFSGSSASLAIRFMIFSFLGTLITPYLGGEWLTFFEKTSHPLNHASIAEFQPATILQYSTGFILFLAALQIGFFVTRYRKISEKELIRNELPVQLLAGGLILGALAVVKFIPIAAILLGSLTARLWRDTGNESSNLHEAVERLRALVRRVPAQGLTFVLVVLALLEAWRIYQSGLDERLIPVEQMDLIVEEKVPGPLLNDFGRGGYVMFRLSDRRGVPTSLVSIDGRTNVTPADVFEEYLASFQGKENWRDFIKRVGAKSILWRTDSPLVQILHATGEWCEISRSGSSTIGHVLFVHSEEKEWLESYRGTTSCSVNEGIEEATSHLR